MPANPRTLTISQRYHDTVDRTARSTAAGVGRLWQAVPLDNFDEGFPAFLKDASQVIALGQDKAASSSLAYFRIVSMTEKADDPGVPEGLEENAGFTFDGRPLDEGLNASLVRTKIHIAEGMPVIQAMDLARAEVQRFALTETMDAAREELHAQYRESPLVVGWRWRSRGTCAKCLAMDSGSIQPDGRIMKAHPMCRCVPEPVFKGVRERVQRKTGHDRVREMNESQLKNVFGEKTGAIIGAGLVDLDELVVTVEHESWRDTIEMKPLTTIVAAAGGAAVVDKLLSKEEAEV